MERKNTSIDRFIMLSTTNAYVSSEDFAQASKEILSYINSTHNAIAQLDRDFKVAANHEQFQQSIAHKTAALDVFLREQLNNLTKLNKFAENKDGAEPHKAHFNFDEHETVASLYTKLKELTRSTTINSLPSITDMDRNTKLELVRSLNNHIKNNLATLKQMSDYCIEHSTPTVAVPSSRDGAGASTVSTTEVEKHVDASVAFEKACKEKLNEINTIRGSLGHEALTELPEKAVKTVIYSLSTSREEAKTSPTIAHEQTQKEWEAALLEKAEDSDLDEDAAPACLVEEAREIQLIETNSTGETTLTAEGREQFNIANRTREGLQQKPLEETDFINKLKRKAANRTAANRTAARSLVANSSSTVPKENTTALKHRGQ